MEIVLLRLVQFVCYTGYMHKRYTSGFTIVELLVVIVVIAILATIAIVSYSWVTRDANNTKRIAGAQELVKVLSTYKLKFGGLPTDIANNSTYCLSDDSSACATNNPGSSPITNATLNELKKVGLSNKPTLPPYSTTFTYHGNTRRKAPIIYTSGGSTAVIIILEGMNQCPAGEKATSGFPNPNSDGAIACELKVP